MDDLNTATNQLTEGLRQLPTDSVARVKHFLAEYLGDTGRPVPFGGRIRDFERLDIWLATPQAPPYALLAAPAGRGKSALLLRWCQRLLGRPDLAVVYFPVSIRFRTNLAGVVFPALVALLARMHGEKVPSDPNMHEEVWHGLLVEYMSRPLLDGRLLILILDGVDEAADWTVGSGLFPEDPPPGLRVVLSARYLANDQDASSWLQRLNWTRPGLARTFELYPLDRAGVASVLLEMGFPLDLLSTRIDIVSELHRLSEGDPLLIRLYVDDLWKRGEAAVRLQPGDLHAIRPGLVGYFERWWNDQRLLWSRETPEREAALQSVLNLLAGALGPLSKEDILNLAPPEAGLHSGTIEQHLEPLERFVIGDGLHQGYVFSHPRLANYFLEERLSDTERREVESRFIDWGAQTLKALNEGILAPERASGYIVQYYGAHLERAQADPEALLALVSDGWRRAWEKLDGANAGFLGDGERAWRAAEREDALASKAGHLAPYLGAEIRSLLCRVSINSMTSNISPRLMLEAVKTGIWTPAQGLACIRLIADLASRAHELVELAPYVQEPLRTDILQEALDTVATIKDEYTRLDALVELASGLTENLLGQVLAIVPTIDDEADRAGLLVELAPALASYPAQIEKALVIAQDIAEEEYLALALAGLADYLFAEQHRTVLQHAQAIQSEKYRVQVLTILVPRFSSTLLSEILQGVRSMRDGLLRVRLLTELVTSLPDPLNTEVKQEILEMMDFIDDPEYRSEVLVKLAPCLAEEELSQALQKIQQIWDESRRVRAMNGLLPYLPEEQLPAFLQAIRAMRNEEYRSAALLQLFPRLPATLQTPALDIVQATWDEGYRADLLARLAPFISEDLLPRLLELTWTLKDPGYQVWLLAELETSLAGKLRVLSFDIINTFRVMKDDEERLQTFLAIIPRLSNVALAKISEYMLPEIFGFKWAIKSMDRRADILTKLSPRLPKVWLPRVIEMVRVLGSEVYQVQVLVALAPRMSEIALTDVLDIVRSMREREKRAQVLEVLISSLPEKYRGKRIREMLQVLQVIKDEEERTRLSAEFATYLPATLPVQKMALVMEAVKAMRSGTNRLGVLRALASRLPEDQFEDALLILRVLRDEEERSHGLKVLAPLVPEQHLSLFLAAIQTLQNERWQLQVLVPLVSHTPEKTFAAALELVQSMPDEHERATALATLALHTPEAFFPEIWQAIQEIKDEGKRPWLLGALVPCISEASFPLLWNAIQDIESMQGQMWLLRTLAARISQDLRSRLWTALLQVNDKEWLTRALSVLASYVPESHFLQVWEIVPTMPELQQWKMLSGLVTPMPESYFPQFWEATKTIPDEQSHAKLLEALAQRVPEHFFPQVWEMVSTMQEEALQQKLLEMLAQHVPERFFPQVWEMVSAKHAEQPQPKLLEALVVRVPESYFFPFWENVCSINNPMLRLQIQLSLLIHISQEKPEHFLRMIQELSDLKKMPFDLLEGLLPYLSAEQSSAFLKVLLPSQPEKSLVDTLEAMRSAWQPRKWVRVLAKLVPRLPEADLLVVLPALLKVLRATLGDHERGELLIALATNVPEAVLREMIEAIWSLSTEQEQSSVLGMLLAQLPPGGWIIVLEMAATRLHETGSQSMLLQALRSVASSAQPPSREVLYPAFHTALHLLAQRTRRDALVDLAPMGSAVRLLGGDAAVAEVYCSTLEVGSWWP